MSSTRPILVATDLSAPADEAVRQAHLRARADGVPLAVCHVIPSVSPSAPLFPQRYAAMDLARPELRERVLAAVGARVQELTGRSTAELDVHVIDGTPSLAIVDLAERLGVPLVVVGSRGASGLERVLLGSVAERVVRYAHCPVLVSRLHPPTGHVLLATDFSDTALPAVAAAAREADHRTVQLTILHSIDAIPLLPDPTFRLSVPPDPLPPELMQEIEASTRERLGEALARHGLSGDLVVTHGPAATAIVEEARSIDADLVILGTLGRTGWTRLLLGSVAEAVVRLAPCSVLVVRLHPEA